jgi:hypothetical protein
LLSRNDEALPKQNYFFGKYNYFNPNSDDVYLGDGLNRIGQTVSEKIYEALGFKL